MTIPEACCDHTRRGQETHEPHNLTIPKAEIEKWLYQNQVLTVLKNADCTKTETWFWSGTVNERSLLPSSGMLLVWSKPGLVQPHGYGQMTVPKPA